MVNSSGEQLSKCGSVLRSLALIASSLRLHRNFQLCEEHAPSLSPTNQFPFPGVGAASARGTLPDVPGTRWGVSGKRSAAPLRQDGILLLREVSSGAVASSCTSAFRMVFPLPALRGTFASRKLSSQGDKAFLLLGIAFHKVW